MAPPPSPSSSLRCGLSGWTYPQWNRTVFPSPTPRGFHPLDYLARFFDVLEINTPILKPELSRLWLQKVAHNSDFRFTAILSRRLTHERMFDPGVIEQVHDGLRPLAEGGKLGCVMMQFPWSFRFTEENREHFIKLRRTFHAYRLVAEMRHSSWMTEEALGTFVDYHVGFVNVDQPQYVKAMPPTSFLTSSIGYVRLHGRNNAHWPQQQLRPLEGTQSNNYLYSPAELEEWKQRIDRIRAFAAETYVVTNNNAGGKSAVNALQLLTMLQGHKRVAPQELHLRYASELKGYVERPKQEALFEMSTSAGTSHKAVA